MLWELIQTKECPNPYDIALGPDDRISMLKL